MLALKVIFSSPEANNLKAKALDDPKLEELWEQIGEL